MKWLLIIIVLIVLLQINPAIGTIATIIYVLYLLLRKSPDQINQTPNSPIQASQSLKLTAGDLADLILLRLELQALFDKELIDGEQAANLTRKIDALCTQHLADFAAVQGNALWQKHRTMAWDLLNQYTDTPLGLPPWRTASPTPFEPIVTTQPEPVTPDIPITPPPLANDLIQAQAATFAIATEPDFPTAIASEVSTTSAPLSIDLSKAQPATFAIDEKDHSLVQPYPPVSPKTNDPNPTLNQYAWKAHEPTRLERALTTLSGWHSMAVPFLVQNIGWFIGVFCFIAGSIFLVHSTQGYASNLIAFFAFFIFTLALLFGGYQLRRQRPELETSCTVIFILSLLLIPLTNITATQLLISSVGLGLQLLSGVLVLAELGVFYFAVTLVSGLMDRSLQQGLPRFFLALTAMSVLQVLLLGLPFWWLLAVIHLLIFVLLSVGVYSFATQWLQSIFVDQHKIGSVAAGMLIYAAVTSFVFITTGNDIVLPAGYYGFFLMLLCGLLFFIDAQLKQWIDRYASLSRFSFLVYGLSVLALCLVAQYPIARMFTLVLAIGLYAYIVWSYLTLTPLTILLVCYFWLYSALVLQVFPDLPASWYFLASLPVLFSLYYAANWALNKRQSAYLAVIVYRVLYGLLATLTVWSLAYSKAGLPAMTTAIIASVLIYYTLKAAPVVIFTPYSRIDPVDLNNHQNLLNSRWFYSIPLLAAVTVFYTPRLPLLESGAQFSLGVLLLSVFWAYQGLNTFFKAHSTSETTPIEQRLNSALFSLLPAVLPLWKLADDMQRVAPLFLAGMIMLWLSYQLSKRWLFYLALIAWAAAFAPLKAEYFPTSSGLVTMLMGIALWFWLWHIERQTCSELIALRREQISQKIALLPSCRLLGWYPLHGTATLFRDLTAAPLEQVMCLFWLLGMKTLFSRFFYHELSYSWLAAVFLVALFSLLLIIRYLLIKLLPVPIALVLGAVIMMLKFFGLETDSLLLVSVLFALVVWRSVRYGLTQTFFIKLAEALNPALANEFEQLEKITHLTAFFIVLGGVFLQLLNVADTQNPIVLLTLIITVWFLWLSDRAYEQLVVRYLVLGFSVLAGIELVSLTLYSFTWQTLTTDGYAALLFTLSSLTVGAFTVPANAYTRPSATTAILLACIGVFLQLLQIIQITAVISPLDYAVLFLAGGSLLLANAKLKWTLCSFTAFMMWILAVLWLAHSLFYPLMPFNLWLGRGTPTDTWLLLALLSLAISLLSQWLKSRQKSDLHYLPPLNTVATLCFVWSLLGTLVLFFDRAGQADLLVGLLLVLLLTIFPLSKDRSGGAQLRGFFSATLSSLIVFCLLPANLDGFALQTANVVFGYTLWLVASFALPHFNKHYSAWRIEPLFFPYLGFLLVALSGCWWRSSFSDFSTGIYCLELSVYSVLMLRYSRWMGFSWLATFAFTGAVLWLENSIVHTNQSLDLSLGLLSLSLSSLSHRLKSLQKWAEVYCLPLDTVATLCFSGALFGTLTLFFASFFSSTGQEDLLVWSFPVLLLAIFSLSKNWSGAAQIRGIASACLLTLTASSLLPASLLLDGFALQTASVVFGYTLWLVATVALPHFNKRYSAWTIEPLFFPWLGLLLVVFSGNWWHTLTAIDTGIYCLELSVYCLLMLRYSNWTGFSWLSAFAFTAAGIAFGLDNEQQLLINLLLWSNLQLLLANFWQHKGEKLAQRWQWQQAPLAQAFECTTWFVFIGYLLIATMVSVVSVVDDIGSVVPYEHTEQDGTPILGILLNLSLLHLLWIRFSVATLHSFIYSLFLSLWAIYFFWLNALFHPALPLDLWSVALFSSVYVISRISCRYQNEMTVAVTNWLRFSVILATLALLIYSDYMLGEWLLSLTIITCLTAALGWRSTRSAWSVSASIELLLLLHSWPFLLVDADVYTLLPGYALQMVLFASLFSYLLTRLSSSDNAEHNERYADGMIYVSGLIALSLLELGGHGILFTQAIMTGTSPQWIMPNAIAALSTGVIIGIMGVRHVRHLPDSKWMYGIVMLAGVMAFYGRLLWLGAEEVGLWDTAVLMGSAYMLFFLQRLFPSRPLLNSALLMPVLALLTVPFQLASPETSLALIMSGLLYVMMRRHTQQKIPLYLALLAFNAGVYVWVPALVDSSQLIQIYVIPAALSSLMLLHLHSRELKPSVLMGSRLAAISSIYACATADVFLRDEQSILVFILAMGLSVAGILIGIALRTRAFLYAGVSFLLLNVIGQLLYFYPEQGLGKAIVLMVMGMGIISLMIWFNIKRVAILQRISAFQTEMQTWE